jgi:hypothetical protein
MKRDMESLFFYKKKTAREMESNLLSKNHEMFLSRLYVSIIMILLSSISINNSTLLG